MSKETQQKLKDAGWEQISENRWRRPDDQEFSTSDAIRVLNGQPALECGTTWPLPFFGENGGQACDMREGPCACGAWH